MVLLPPLLFLGPYCINKSALPCPSLSAAILFFKMLWIFFFNKILSPALLKHAPLPKLENIPAVMQCYLNSKRNALLVFVLLLCLCTYLLSLVLFLDCKPKRQKHSFCYICITLGMSI